MLRVANLNSDFPAPKYFSCRGLKVMKDALILRHGYIMSKYSWNLRVEDEGDVQKDLRFDPFCRLPQTLVLQIVPLFTRCYPQQW